MPYTPPSRRSPASSAPTSPDASRRSSFHAGEPRPPLPRSASYLTRHRRGPSVAGTGSHGPIEQPSPEATSEDLKAMMTSPSIRQSPPPVTEARGMPKGVVLSPPESASGSDEDEAPEERGRRIETENMKALQDAISHIPQRRERSPSKSSADDELLVLPPQVRTLADGLHHSFSAMTLGELAQGARKISHARSRTDPSAAGTKSADASVSESEAESEAELLNKPQMVRKKSGELVRPALRPPSRRRPSSMPGTPTFSKAVHFDSHLEHVRHFLQVDRPLAVSVGSSPADNYESDNEFPFPGDERRTPPYEWEIIVGKFPVESLARKALAVKLERIWLSPDQKCLVGSVAVANLAFHKSVVCRFTLDYWKTTSEVAAEYVAEIRPRETPRGHDRFNFTIKLSDLAHLESKTLFFCIRYTVAGQEFWDSNDGTNFQVDFKKKMLPQNGKNNYQGASSRPVNALPRSNRRPNPSSVPRPRSLPVGFDDFGDGSRVDFAHAQSIHDYLGEPGPSLRLKGTKSTSNLPSDNLAARLSSPSGQAFANRYDFGASLTAAVQAAKDTMSKPDGLYMRTSRRPTPAYHVVPRPAPAVDPPPAQSGGAGLSTLPAANEVARAANEALPVVPAGSDAASTAGISDASYDEIVRKYCFVRTAGRDSPSFKSQHTRSSVTPIQ